MTVCVAVRIREPTGHSHCRALVALCSVSGGAESVGLLLTSQRPALSQGSGLSRSPWPGIPSQGSGGVFPCSRGVGRACYARVIEGQGPALAMSQKPSRCLPVTPRRLGR